MAGIIFSEGSGLNNSIFGAVEAPIKLFLEKRAEEFEQESPLKKLFYRTPSEHFGEMLTTLTAMSGFQPVGENGAYPNDEMQEGYSKFLRNMTWKDQFAISEEMIEDSQLLNLQQRPENFLTGYYRTEELFGAALYGAAIQGQTSVTFRGKAFDTAAADGKAVFADDHRGKVKGAGQANRFKDAFSVDALSAMETAMQQFKGDNGEIVAVHPDTILIPNDYTLKKAVFAAIGADKDPATANNGFNYQYGRWNVIVWSYLNDALAAGTAPWILLDSKYNERQGGAVWFDRKQLTISSKVDDNDAAVWKGRARFVAGFNDWRFAAAGGISAASTTLVS